LAAQPKKSGNNVNQMNSWDRLIASLPAAHIFQTWEWGEVKAKFGWRPGYFIWLENSQGITMVEFVDGSPLPAGNCIAAALVLRRTAKVMGFPLHVLYAPKGPLLDWRDQALRTRVLADLATLARRQRAIFLKIDPDVCLGRGIAGDQNSMDDLTGKAVLSDFQQSGWRWSAEQIQYRNTMLVDLTLTENELLANMKQKTRYNLRLAERKGVKVRVGTSTDIPLLYEMYAETSLRDGFVIRDQAYYHCLWKTFMDAGMAVALIAEVNGEVLAALILFNFSDKTWYLYGMSRDIQREKMPNYLLQWEAMRYARAKGCTEYDLWGAPDTFDASDLMWGVYRFKEGLGGDVVRWIGAWDFPIKPAIYQLYTRILPRLLDLMRRRGQDRTRQQVRSITGV
jgi:peptidoglycan pentaglycine glycine transferase (the first glycine)